jgi:threonine/homoserine/homoserine lactone efflux protein
MLPEWILKSVVYGFLIGILVSAPMGPIGLLCLQRTIYKGRWHGFFSGVGAAFSDLIYAMITAMGMGIVVLFIEDNQAMLQIVGSVLLMIFGIYTFRSRPHFRTPKEGSRKKTYSQDALTAFFLTFSNPLIIFLFIALFARFNFIDPDYQLFSMVLGLFGIFGGAIFWWFVLTMLVGMLHGKFQERGLRIINRLVGGAIFILAVIGLIYSICQYA